MKDLIHHWRAFMLDRLKAMNKSTTIPCPDCTATELCAGHKKILNPYLSGNEQGK